MAIAVVVLAAATLVVLARRSAPWWTSATVIVAVGLMWGIALAVEVGEPDARPGLLVFGGVMSVGFLLILELVLWVLQRRSRPHAASRE